MFYKKPAENGAKQTALPSDINASLQQTITAVMTLQNVLIKENEALESCKSADFFALQDEKVESGKRYESLVSHLMEHPDKIKTADARLKEQLQKLQNSFGETTRRNLQLLERMNTATGKLKEQIVQAACKAAETHNQFSYGASGKMQKGAKSTIGVNERA